MRKRLLLSVIGAATLLGAATAAQASFIEYDNIKPQKSTIDIVPSNDFRGTFHNLGVDQYTLGASLGVDAAGTLTYYYYGIPTRSAR
jgi:hypothetical protein